MIPIVITIFLIVGYVFYKSSVDPKIKVRWIAIFVDVIFVFIAIPVSRIYLSALPIFESKEQREARAKDDLFKKRVLEAIVNNSMNTDEIQEIIQGKYKVFYNSSEREAEQWAKDFVQSVETKRNTLNGIDEREREIAKKLSFKIKPYLDYYLKQFDDRISALEQQKGSISKFSDASDKVVVYGDELRNSAIIKRVNLPNNFLISANFMSAQIINGEISQDLVLEFLVGSKGRGMTTALQIWISPSKCRLRRGDQRYYYVVNEELSTELDPIGDSRFRIAVVDSISKLIESIYIKDQIS